MIDERKEILRKIVDHEISASDAMKAYQYLENQKEPKSSVDKNDNTSNKEDAVAIVGMSGRFSGADNLNEYWEILKNNICTSKPIPKERTELYNCNFDEKKYIQKGGFLSQVQAFDPYFFQISPKEAEYMDPRQRLMLEETWKAIEDSGHKAKDYAKGKCGVFVGIQQGEYLNRWKGEVNESLPTGNSLSIISARISYFLDLKGPSVALDTACSSSLSAIFLAYDSIQNGSCDTAIAGGIQLMLEPNVYCSLGKSGMLCESGVCRPFDSQADGIGLGEGVGVIILKKLSEAQRENDKIYGIIEGIGWNQDGKTNGITAPNGLSQAKLIREVYQKNGIHPKDISYVETHGTGTPIGDPIEIQALKEVYQGKVNIKACAVSSVKGNIGHTLSASGVASVIKVLLSLKHHTIPAIVNFQSPNEMLDIENSPFYLVTQNQRWEAKGNEVRRAAISSFGMSGTNCHMVLREYIPKEKALQQENDLQEKLFVLSAKSLTALKQKKEDIIHMLQHQKMDEQFSDLCYVSLIGREVFAYRAAYIVRSAKDLLEALQHARYDKREDGEKQENLYRLRELEKGAQAGKKHFTKKELEVIRTCFLQGETVLFDALFCNMEGKRISLPTYPFERIDCWKEEKEKSNDTEAVNPKLGWLQKDTSTMDQISFTSMVSEKDSDYFAKNIYDYPVIPEGYLLDMACTAGEAATKKRVTQIKNLCFSGLIHLPEEMGCVKVCLQGEDLVPEVLIKIIEGRKEKILAHGFLKTENLGEPEPEDFSSFGKEADFTEERNGEIFYEILAEQGYHVKPDNRMITRAYYSFQEAYGFLDASNKGVFRMGDVLEGMTQLLNLVEVQHGNLVAGLYEIEKLVIYGDCGKVHSLYAKENQRTSHKSYDVMGYDESGERIFYAEGIHLLSFDLQNIQSEEAYCLMEPKWVSKELTEESQEISSHVLILLNLYTPQSIVEELNQAFPYAQYIRNNFDNKEECLALADGLIADKKDYKGLLDFSDIWEEEHLGISYGKILFYQKILRLRLAKGLQIFHFTSKTQNREGIQISLNGTAFGGLVRILDKEYRGITARTIDMDCSIEYIKAYIQVIQKEWKNSAADVEILYEKNKRYVLEYALVKNENKWIGRKEQTRILLHPEKVYIVTGATRGIGAQVAQRLVMNGAKKLVLTGISPYPKRKDWKALIADTKTPVSLKEKLKRILLLEKEGVQIEIYTQDLSDKEKLRSFLSQVKVSLGEIDGVIHCAGDSRDAAPAFLNKKIEDIQAVYRPKMDAMHSIHEVLKEEKLSFFLVFSSISGALPQLAVGLSDYGTANYYMERFVNYQHDQGYSFYQAVSWPSWKEVGMLVDKNFNLGDAYQKLGIKVHGLSDGLFMLTDILQNEERAVLLPAIVKKDEFSCCKPLMEKRNEIVDKKMEITAKIQGKTVQTEEIQRVRNVVAEILVKELHIDRERLHDQMAFSEIGVDSIILVDAIKALENIYHIVVEPALFFEYPTLWEFSEYLSLQVSMQSEVSQEINLEENRKTVQKSGLEFERKQQRTLSGFMDKSTREKIAVIGIGCRFAGADNKEEYWNNLVQGVDSITEVPKERFDIEPLYSKEWEPNKSTGKWGGFLSDIKSFDSEFFGFKENAEQVSPLMRQYLEAVVNAISDAGYSLEELSGAKAGVYVGTHAGSYPSWVKEFHKETIIGIGQNFIASYVSHFLNLKGPSFTVDSACSSSLMSLHLACQSIWMKETTMAIAGGVDLLLDERPYMVFSASKAMSEDGRCHTFDVKANGIVPGEGCGAVLLKPLSKALSDHDFIYGVIEASAANNDGRTMGVTTPNMSAQMEIIKEALSQAEIDPNTIGYVETHGTGTMIGDPIELKALTKVYREFTQDVQYCGIGSVKTNIGHCLSAAGIASFIKTILCISKKTLVPTLNCEEPNPRFDFNSSPFYPVLETKPWERTLGIRRAGISSFGFGGTNVHMIVGESLEALNRKEDCIRKSIPPTILQKKQYWVKDHQEQSENAHEDVDGILEFIEG